MLYQFNNVSILLVPNLCQIPPRAYTEDRVRSYVLAFVYRVRYTSYQIDKFFFPATSTLAIIV